MTRPLLSRPACLARHPPRAPAMGAALALAAWASLGLAGCGYGHQELYPEQYRSVAVPIFENRTFWRGVEFELTEAITKQIEERTPYKVLGPGLADTTLSGFIVDVEQVQISRRRLGNTPQQLEITITLDFRWTDNRTGRVILDRRGFTSTGQYLPAIEVGEFLELAIQEATQAAAIDIVSQMRSDWGAAAELAAAGGPEATADVPADPYAPTGRPPSGRFPEIRGDVLSPYDQR